MIRKVSHIIISMFLLILTMGFSVSKHYCGNHLVEVSFSSNVDAGCSSDGSCEMERSCCHDELRVFQLDEDYTAPTITDHIQFVQQDLAIVDFGCIISNLTLSDNSLFISDAESPPPLVTSKFLSTIQVYRL